MSTNIVHRRISSLTSWVAYVVITFMVSAMPLLVLPANALAAEDSLDVPQAASADTSQPQTESPVTETSEAGPSEASSSTPPTTPTTESISATATPETAPAEPSSSANPSQDTVVNESTSAATTGDASVSGLNSANNITTGDAAATATHVNLVQSNVALENNAQPTLFTYDITGSVNGNLLVVPDTQAGQAPSSTSLTPVIVISSADTSMANIINLAAVSGDIIAQNNGTIGSSTTGNAQAAANIVNLLDSGITANQSFIGVVNIFGNLTGDILLPTGIISGLQATPSSTITQNNELATATTRDAVVTNAITSGAISGDVQALNNELVGNITTGDATNNTQVLNLLHYNITSDNMLLVFVNVLGTWQGFLLDLPAGQTTYMTSAGTVSDEGSPAPMALADQTQILLANTINVLAQSGAISLINNERAGDVHSGNAKTSVNIINIVGSHINLSGWFGVLFINVFGTWSGNVAEQAQESVLPDAPEAVVASATTASSHRSHPLRHMQRYVTRVAHAASSAAAPAVAGYTIENTGSKALVFNSDKALPKASSTFFFALAGIVTVFAAAAGTRYYASRRA